MRDYLRHNWNGRANGPSPAMFWGVEPTGESDHDAMRIYRVREEVQRLMADTIAVA